MSCTSGFTDDVFYTMGPIGGRSGTALCTSSPFVDGGAQVAVDRPAC